MDLDWLVGQPHITAVLEDLGPEPRSFRVWGPPGTGVSRLTAQLLESGHDAREFDSLEDLTPQDQARSIVLRLRRIPESRMIEHLRQSLEPEMAALVALRADGNMREAVEMAERAPDLETFQALYGAPDLAPALLSALRSGNLPRAVDVMEAYARHSPDPETLVDDAIAHLTRELGHTTDPRGVISSIRALWEIRSPMANTRMPARAKLTVILATLADHFYQEAPALILEPQEESIDPGTLRQAMSWTSSIR